MLKLSFLNILKFSLFSFFRFKCLSQQIFNIWGWNWSQMFTYFPYYPPLAITHFNKVGPLHIKCHVQTCRDKNHTSITGRVEGAQRQKSHLHAAKCTANICRICLQKKPEYKKMLQIKIVQN